MAVDSRTTSIDPVAASVASDGTVCPFCAHIREPGSAGACPKCTMEDTPGTRRSTGERIGPWFVLQRRNPTAPGLRFSVLLTLARRGHVTPKSIVRGPTTGQLWRYAIQVKGLSRVFGACWHCQRSVSPDATTCPHCRSAQEIPDDPDTFLETHAMLPVMREVPAVQLESNDLTRPAPLELPDATDAPQRGLVRTQDGPRPGGFDSAEELSRALATRRSVAMRTSTTGREAGESIMSASELASIFQLEAPPAGFVVRTRRRLWKLTRAIAVLALLLGIGGGAVWYLKPEWITQAREASEPYIAQAKTAWSNLLARVGAGQTGSADPSNASNDTLPPTTPIRLEVVDKSLSPATAPASTFTVVSGPSSPVVPPPEAPRITLTPKALPEAIPSVVDATGPTEIDALAGQASIFTPTTKPIRLIPANTAPAVSTAQPGGASPIDRTDGPSNPSLSTDEAQKQADELRKSALDAEARRDWKAALIIWEQIARLPEEARPSDLKVRLQNARERLAE